MRIDRRVATALAALILAHGAVARAQAPTQQPPAVPVSIGVARMEADGTIVLQLIARGPGGARGEGLLRYPPSHPDYAAILRHVGPLWPGEERPVAPFPD
jgi:hypothetical protein